MIRAALIGTGSEIPGRTVSNEEVGATLDPPVDADYILERTGIEQRNWMDPDAKSAPVGARVLTTALEEAGLAATDLSRIIFTSSGGGDWTSPSNAGAIAHELGLSGSCDCFDINNACTGFLTSVDLACRSVATGMGPVAVVVVEKISDIFDPNDKRTALVFGDAAAALVFGAPARDQGLLSSVLVTDPSLGRSVSMKHPRWSGVFEPVRFEDTNKEMVQGALRLLLQAGADALAAAGTTIDDIEWVLPHQPNGRMYDSIVQGLGADPAKTLKVVHKIGSTAGAAIPVSLDRLRKERPVKPGDRVLMVGIGGGVSYGAVVLKL